MNAELVSPMALIGLLAAPGGRDPGRARRGPLAWLAEELRYRRALWALNRFDDRDLDDLNLGRGDLPALARRHARAAA
jgi:uncharacterized protein YjiS (DUF1127 family)